MYGIFRDNYPTQGEDINEWFETESDAIKVANELNEIYKEDDGHPWQGSRFYSKPLSEEYIRLVEWRSALQKANAV